MKNKLTLLSLFCLGAFTASAQLVDVVTGLNFPFGLALKGNELYVSQLGAYKISKIDISISNPPIVDVKTGLDGPTALIFNGNDLIYGEELTNRISKFELSQPNTNTLIASLASSPWAFFLDGNYLYNAQNNGDITKFDLSQLPVTSEIVTTVSDIPVGMVKKGTDLYVAEFGGNKITKIDLSTTPAVKTTFATGFYLPGGMTLNGNFIYVAENSKISRIDITQPNPTPETVVSGVSQSRLVAFDGIDMYIAQKGGGKISKLQIGQPVFSNIGAVCSGMVTDDLGGASPTGGSYSGPGVTDNADGETFSFNPTVAGGIGTYTVTYTSQNGQTATSTINVIAPPTVTYTPPASISLDAGPLALSGGMPAGGIYSGPGVSGGNFDPAVAGIGTHTITYTYTLGSGHGCSVSASGSITVKSPDDACAGATDINNLFAGAINMPVVSGQYDNTGYDAVGDPGNGYNCFVENSGPSLEHTIWYSFTGTGHTYRIRSVQCGATPYNDDTQVAIYSGSCGNLVPVACNDDENEAAQIYNISVDIPTQGGVTYWMMIDGYGGTVGKFCLEVTKTALSAVTNIEETNLQLFPNPTTGEIQLRNVQADAVQVHDNMGRLVLTQENPGTSIDISSAPAGVYFLKIMEGGKVYSARVVKE